MLWKRRLIVVPAASSLIGLLMPYLLIVLQRSLWASDGARRALGGMIVALAPFTFLAALGPQWVFERDQLEAALLNAALYAVGGVVAVFVARRGKALRLSVAVLLALWIVVATWFGAGWIV